ncbi:glycosyltransferase family 4 protein [Candidatus Amarolinea aalborgensis]|uniref:glycosyltransferase family 4 protein n=1 Tax=Candidatus Amarolinea aalborgensis TaxID=2249329 RepID=UPI003BF94911
MIAPTGFFADYGCHVRIRGHAQALQARGHQVRIVTYPGGREVPGLCTVRPPWRRHDQEMPVGSSWRKFGLDFLLALTVWQTAQRWSPDLIHAYLHEGALLGALLPVRRRPPVVFDFQGSLVGEMLDHRFLAPRSPLLPAWRRLERWIDQRPAAILASSQHARELLITAFGVPAARVTTLPDSVDAAQFRPASAFSVHELAQLRSQLGLPPDRPLVVYLGLLASYQGIDLLLAAAQRLQRDPPTTAGRPFFLIMGFPFVEHYRRQAQRLGLAADVLFTGMVPFAEAPRFVALGDVAVAPKLSTTEGSGKLLTYMASALPVVAFETPVHREYLGDLGFYAPAADVAGLARALTLALSDRPAAQARGARLRTRAMQQYTWPHAAAAIEEVYRRVSSFCGPDNVVTPEA